MSSCSSLIAAAMRSRASTRPRTTPGAGQSPVESNDRPLVGPSPQSSRSASRAMWSAKLAWTARYEAMRSTLCSRYQARRAQRTWNCGRGNEWPLLRLVRCRVPDADGTIFSARRHGAHAVRPAGSMPRRVVDDDQMTLRSLGLELYLD